MQKRNFYSLLLISLIAVFMVSSAFADGVTFETKAIPRCVDQTATVTAVVTTANISALEVIVEISGDYTLPAAGSRFTFDPGFTALATRVVDDTSDAHGTGVDTLRIAAMLTSPSDAPLAAGTYVIGRIHYHSKDVCTGSVNLKPAVFTYPIPATIQTQFVDASTSAILPVAVTNGVITISDQAPAIVAIPNATIHWGATYTGTASGSDPDMANGCETLTYSKVAGPAAMTVNPSTGAISWLTTGADVCTHPVTIQVADKCGTVAQTSFTICVQNTPPVITCPGPLQLVLGDTAKGTITSTDPDGGPAAPLYSLLSFNGPGSFAVNPVSGAFAWPTIYNNASYLGTWTATVVVTDGANVCAGCSPSNADTCSFQITVSWGKVVVQKVEKVLLGGFTDVNIYMATNYPVGGFDLLLSYDNSALSLQQVLPGKFISDCKWEYFTYRFGPFGNCTGACPSGMVKIVALAETNNGNAHPSCFTNYPNVTADSTIATLHFLVSSNATLNCSFLPISWYWIDCTDNDFSNVKGDSLLISRYVYGFGGSSSVYYRIDDKTVGFPTTLGAQAECDTHNKPGKPNTWRVIDFFNGGIDIICAESIDARGDINLNGIANEVADVVMFTNYFISGLSAFQGHIPGSIAASDVNNDGFTLTVADLVYLIRVVVGDALPYPKATVGQAINTPVTNDMGVLSTGGKTPMGGAFILVAGNVTPELLAKNMKMSYLFDGQNTRIVVVPPLEQKGNTGFTGNFIDVHGTVVSMDLATLDGQMVAPKLTPKSFTLSQNYPNPFHPTTKIEFALPTASDYTLTIYNVQGQVVKTFEGSSDAGYQTVEWNAGSNASGVYFYKLTAGTYSATKKMVLLK